MIQTACKFFFLLLQNESKRITIIRCKQGECKDMKKDHVKGLRSSSKDLQCNLVVMGVLRANKVHLENGTTLWATIVFVRLVQRDPDGVMGFSRET